MPRWLRMRNMSVLGHVGRGPSLRKNQFWKVEINKEKDKWQEKQHVLGKTTCKRGEHASVACRKT
jgi:hypothetical protein